MRAVVTVLDKNDCRRFNVKNIFPATMSTSFSLLLLWQPRSQGGCFCGSYAIIEKAFPCKGNGGMSATKKKKRSQDLHFEVAPLRARTL